MKNLDNFFTLPLHHFTSAHLLPFFLSWSKRLAKSSKSRSSPGGGFTPPAPGADPAGPFGDGYAPELNGESLGGSGKSNSQE